MNSYRSGDIKTVTWISTDIISDTTGEANTVDLKYSRDGGSTWVTIAEREINDGSYSWTIPLIPSSKNCVVRITHSEDATIYSDSETFEVIGGPVPLILNAVISSATYNPVTLEVVFTVTGAGENQYPVSRIWFSKGASTYAITVSAWGDTTITGSLASPLTPGDYDANMVTSDNQQVSLSSAISLPSVGRLSLNLGIAVCAA